MKKIQFLILILLTGSIITTSCSDGVTYAEQLKAEKATIQAYLKREGIKVITKVPENKIWAENEYLLTESGLYFHLVDSGDVQSGDTLESYNTVVPRFKEYTLTETADTTIRNWTTIEYPFPATFIYGNSTESCAGFQEAASLMKRNYSRAKVIISSKIGFYSTSTTSVVPYGYDLKIKIQK